jgi:hypothetical protein
MHKRLLIVAASAACVMWGSSALAQEAKNTDKCMKTAGKEAFKYISQYQKNVGKCIEKVTKELVGKDQPTAAKAAKGCASALAQIASTDKPDKIIQAKMDAKIAKKCDGSAGLEGTGLLEAFGQGPDIAGLDTYCSQLGADMSDGTADTVDTLTDWLACIGAATTCQAQQSIAVAQPEAAESLREAATQLALLPADTKITDAIATANAIADAIDGDQDGTPDIVCGTVPDPDCGDGDIDTGIGVSIDEECDGTEFGGATCQTLGFTRGGTLACSSSCQFDISGCSSQAFAATGQTISWAASTVDGGAGTSVDDDGAVQSGTAANFTDATDTVTDENTGLVWLKLNNSDTVADAGNPRDADNTYPWSSTSVETIWDAVADINAGNMGGRNDWRIANVNELLTLVDKQAANPASYSDIPNVKPGFYLSSTTFAASPTTAAWAVDYGTGAAGSASKSGAFYLMVVAGPDL